MKNLKSVKVGDVIDVSKRDLMFVNSCFSRSVQLKDAATKLFTESQAAAKIAWDSIYIKWPELTKFHLEINSKDKCIIIQAEK